MSDKGDTYKIGREENSQLGDIQKEYDKARMEEINLAETIIITDPKRRRTNEPI